VLFITTFLTTLSVGASYELSGQYLDYIGREVSGLGTYLGTRYFLPDGPSSLEELLLGMPYALSLLFILLSHEMGHFLMAKRHKVKASLPYFIPVPFFLGTFGAIIRIRSKIYSRNELMDIGALGPICGIIASIIVLTIGLSTSEVRPVVIGGIKEGDSLLYLLMKRLILGEIPSGSDVFLNQVAYAGWIGFLITMINLMPAAQLDGGHVAYALFGKVQDRITYYAIRGLFGLGIGIGLIGGLWAYFKDLGFYKIIQNSLLGSCWIIWGLVLLILCRVTGKRHPEVICDLPLTLGKWVLGIICIILFGSLFMPVVMSTN
jgi:membrane-associated protease RseP (regulator of RpoE activity)